MKYSASNSQGLNITTLVACLGLFLLIVTFTISTLCAEPSETVDAAPFGSPGMETETAQAQAPRDSLQPRLNALAIPAQAVEVSNHEDVGNPTYPSLQVISFSLAGLASSEPRFNGWAPVTPAETNRPSPFAPEAVQVSGLEDASLISLIVVNSGTMAALTPGFDPDVTSYALSVDADAVSVVAETAEAGARIISTAVGDVTTIPDPASNRLAASVSLAEGAITEFAVTVQARDGVTTRTYRVELYRPSPASAPPINASFDFG